ncbi:MAG: protein-L-isoaspartate O-methyltransferase [Paracoccaceae bacterium]
MTDFARRRTTMVDTQVRPSDVTKFPIIDAMLTVAREDFVPADKRDAAYADAHIDLGDGRVVMDPRTLAKMLEAADIQPDELVLDVGAGLGYSSALAGRLGEAVIALEEDEDRVSAASGLLAEAGIDNAAAVHGTLSEGAAKHGPYDVILLQGAVEHMPEALTDQLKDGGRIAAIFAEGALGVMRVGYRIDGAMTWRFAFNAGAPVIPGFEARRAFTL